MTLTRGRLVGYEFDRMVMLFSMMDGQREIPCAISTSAMDHLESVTRSKPDQRETQFMRLREQIEERAARKFLTGDACLQKPLSIVIDVGCRVILPGPR
jgi:hypothetical protein